MYGFNLTYDLNFITNIDNLSNEIKMSNMFPKKYNDVPKQFPKKHLIKTDEQTNYKI